MAFKAILIDLNGTLHIESTAIPGAVEALKRLRGSGIPLRFVTNTSKESKRFLHHKLTTMGFEIELNEIFTSLTSTRFLVETLQLRPKLLLEDEAMEDFDGLPLTQDNYNAVVIGLAPSRFNFKELNEAFRLVLAGASLIAINKGRYYQCHDGPALGPGPFITALEYATDKKAKVVGKPEKSFFLNALEGMGCSPHEAVMIGDDIRDDVLGAQDAGMVGILVKTGKYREGDENITAVPPNYICEDFSAAVDFIMKIRLS